MAFISIVLIITAVLIIFFPFPKMFHSLKQPIAAILLLGSALLVGSSAVGYNDAGWLEKDRDLKALRELPEFIDLVEQIKSST